MFPHLRARWRAAVAGSVISALMLTAAPAMAAADTDFQLEAFPQDASVTHFSNDFGDRRSGGRRHEGNDLMAPKMTPVYAAASGVVSYIGPNRRAGRYLIVDHGDGWETWYIHLNNDNPGTDDGKAPWTWTVVPGIEVGTYVQAGRQIGWVGDSGNAEGSGPHTHFEIQHNGRSLNPYPYLVPVYEKALAEHRPELDPDAVAADPEGALTAWLRSQGILHLYEPQKQPDPVELTLL